MNSSENQVKRLTVDNIEVPAGMLSAALNEYTQFTEKRLAAALLWLAENPIVPSDEQIWEAAKSFGVSYKVNYSVTRQFFSNWQQIMFLRKEDALPDEVKKLLYDIGDESNKRILAAYKLGKSEGK